MDDYAEYDGMGLAALVRERKVSPTELLDAAIARIERHNGAINAVIYKAYDEARAVAAGPLPDGPFRGVPFLIKDFGVRVKGWPRTTGSRFATVAADEEDTPLIQRHRAAGLVLAGKTNTPEFAIPGVTTSAALGPCRNPWSTEHITGGSSGGAAAAVASGMVPMAHASDGLGSIRIPASLCGLVGLKTTRDRNPNGPHDTDRVIGLSVDHVVTRTVRDSAAMLDATGFPEPGTPYAWPAKERPYLEEAARSPGKLRIAWSAASPSGRPIDVEILALLARTAQTLAALGHDVREQAIELDWRAFYEAQGKVSAANFAAGMRRWIELKGREPGGDIEGLARRAYEYGKSMRADDAFYALQELRRMSKLILGQFEQWDVYLQPMRGAATPRVDELNPLSDDLPEFDRRQARALPFTPPYNITGQPSLSLPLWHTGDGLPLGMMFTARYGDEATLFRLAGQLEKELPWIGRKPPIWG